MQQFQPPSYFFFLSLFPLAFPISHFCFSCFVVCSCFDVLFFSSSHLDFVPFFSLFGLSSRRSVFFFSLSQIPTGHRSIWVFLFVSNVLAFIVISVFITRKFVPFNWIRIVGIPTSWSS